MSETDRNHRFKLIFENHKGIFFKVARTYCKNEDDRRDLIQEICIQVLRSLDKYDEKYKLSTWLYRIALNVAISYYRKHSTRNAKTIALDDNVPHVVDAESFDNESQLLLLEKFISELNDLDKALMILYLEDKNHSEIAEILGITISNVGTKIGRIKEKIRTRFLKINK